MAKECFQVIAIGNFAVLIINHQQDGFSIILIGHETTC